MGRSSGEYWSNRFLRDEESDERVNSVLSANSNGNNGRNCDPESSKALKKIISLLDDLNNSDLRLLDDIIERMLCERRC